MKHAKHGRGGVRGILLTLVMLVILVLITGELTSYVLLDINYSQLASQAALSSGSGSLEASVNLGLQDYLQSALPQAVSIAEARQPKLQVASFNGISSYVTVANSPTVSPSPQMSMFAWVRPLSQSSAIVAKPSSYGMKVGVQGAAPGQFAGYVWGSTGVCASYPFALQPGTWYSVGFTFNGTAIREFVDGQLYCTVQYSGSVPVSSSSVVFGGPSDADGYAYGSMANVQLYNTGLSASAAAIIYQRGPEGSPLSTGLSAWWPLNGNVLDMSGNGNNGAATALGYLSVASNSSAASLIGGILETGLAFGSATSLSGSALPQYISALEGSAASQQLRVSITNSTLQVYSNSAYSIAARYTGLATVVSGSGNYSFPVSATAIAVTAPSQDYVRASAGTLSWP